MPISVQITRGLLTPDGERQIVPRIAEALLAGHGLADNAFMKQNVFGHLLISEPDGAFVGGLAQSLAVVEVKVPSVTFTERATREKFVQTVTDLIHELRAGSHPKQRTFVNITYAVDGAWGIGGKAYSNDDLGAAIAASPPPA